MSDALDRLLERLRRFADMNGADTQTCRETVEALVALREQHDRVRIALLEQLTRVEDELDRTRAEVDRLDGIRGELTSERDRASEARNSMQGERDRIQAHG